MTNFFDTNIIDKFISTASAYGVSELEIADGENKLKIKFSAKQLAPSQTKQTIIKEQNIPQSLKGDFVKTPLAGIFYASPTPESPPFVTVGQRVSKGDVLCIIEAMKMMNEIESEFTGIIKEIFVSNEESVETGQSIFLISAES